jgi:ribonuclease G
VSVLLRIGIDQVERDDLDGQGVVLRVNPDIARALKEEEHLILRDLQQTLGKQVTIRPDAHLHHEQFDVMAI